jgi:HTH-type transcriptional regulator/antitoxin HigA
LNPDDFEKKFYPTEAPEPIEAIKIRMQELHLKQLDLVQQKKCSFSSAK